MTAVHKRVLIGVGAVVRAPRCWATSASRCPRGSSARPGHDRRRRRHLRHVAGRGGGRRGGGARADRREAAAGACPRPDVRPAARGGRPRAGCAGVGRARLRPHLEPDRPRRPAVRARRRCRPSPPSTSRSWPPRWTSSPMPSTSRAIEPTVRVARGEGVVTPGSPGRALDREATAAAMTRGLPAAAGTGRGGRRDGRAHHHPGGHRRAVALVAEATVGTRHRHGGNGDGGHPGKAVGRALSFSPQGGQLVPTLDGSVLHEAIAEELSPIEVEGRDATFRIKNGKPKVVKSKVGTGVSDDELAAAVEGVLDLPAAERTVTVSVGTREPALTTEQAKTLGVKERLSTFTQNFPYAAYRVQNIGQAAERINGTLLLPGRDLLDERHHQGAHGGERLHRGLRRRRGRGVRRGAGRWRVRCGDDDVDRRLLRRDGARPDRSRTPSTSRATSRASRPRSRGGSST